LPLISPGKKEETDNNNKKQNKTKQKDNSAEKSPGRSPSILWKQMKFPFGTFLILCLVQ
jgi:hypothetical protein